MSDLKEKILAQVADDQAAIEKALKANLNPYLELVSQVAQHILFGGGKRIRPLLMVLAARICGYQGDYAATLSTAFEFAHAASLLHDDLVDNAAVRRGKDAAHLLYGNSIAVLVGDFLMARSLTIAAKTERLKVVQIISKITEKMSQGEIHQLMRIRDLDLSQAEYMDVIKNKTAFLMEGACQVGAIIADADPQKERALAAYGLNLGIAFQMADDLLDYISETAVLGKEIGADLKEGKLTLPVIYALSAASPADRKWMAALITEGTFSAQEFEDLKGMLHHYGGIDYTHKQAEQYISKAKVDLDVFEASKTKEILFNLADYTVSRKA